MSQAHIVSSRVIRWTDASGNQTGELTRSIARGLEPGRAIQYDSGMDRPSVGRIEASDLDAFEAAARRPLSQRIHYSFIHTFKPVLDEASYRSFDSMADYRRWCAEHLPSWLGYGPAASPEPP